VGVRDAKLKRRLRLECQPIEHFGRGFDSPHLHHSLSLRQSKYLFALL